MSIGWTKSDKPAFKHDCEECRFISSVKAVGDKVTKTLDIYAACDASICDYSLRWSDEPSDYQTVKDVTELAALLLANMIWVAEAKEVDSDS